MNEEHGGAVSGVGDQQHGGADAAVGECARAGATFVPAVQQHGGGQQEAVRVVDVDFDG